jgi:DNA-binding CsgD family transcriptional regulator
MGNRDADALTPREHEVLDLVRLGLTNEEIAERLGITLDGAKYHVSQILSKLGVATREEAAALRAEPERRRWWVALPLAAKAAGAALVVAAVAGLGVLAWGVWETEGDDGATTAEPTSGPPTNVPSVLGPKELAAFRMCTDNENWQRPTEEAMQPVWQSPLFGAMSQEAKREALGQNFFWYNEDADEATRFALLSGIGSGPSGEDRSSCGYEGTVKLTVELWTLLYQVVNVEYLGGTLYRAHVTPTESGWRAVRFGRTAGTVDPTIALVGPDQSVLGCLGANERCEQIAVDWAETLDLATQSPPVSIRHSSQSLGVDLAIPVVWEPDPSYSGGTSEDPQRWVDPRGVRFGFIQISACCGGQSVDQVATMSTQHRKKPYGESPVVEARAIPAGDARFITADSGAPDPHASALIVKFPKPVQVAGAQFEFLTVWAHKDYIRTIAETVAFVAPNSQS